MEAVFYRKKTMKKPFLFVSDFDGTMSQKDFYQLFSETNLKNLHEDLLAQYKRKEITSFGYLERLLAELNHTEQELRDAINSLPVDPMVKTVFDFVRDNGGDCAVVSAGADYYIRPIMNRVGLENIPLYANRGEFIDGGIRMTPPENPAYYSPLYGIDKELVMKDLVNEYETVMFAGDGTADFKPARLASIRFAKDVLAFRLKMTGHEFHKLRSFDSIYQFLKNDFF